MRDPAVDLWWSYACLFAVVGSVFAAVNNLWGVSWLWWALAPLNALNVVVSFSRYWQRTTPR